MLGAAMPKIHTHLTTQARAVYLIKGEGNRSSVGTLVERTTRFVVLAKMDNAGTRSVVDSFSGVLKMQLAELRKSMTHDSSREMHCHKILTERTGVQVTAMGVALGF